MPHSLPTTGEAERRYGCAANHSHSWRRLALSLGKMQAWSTRMGHPSPKDESTGSIMRIRSSHRDSGVERCASCNDDMKGHLGMRASIFRAPIACAPAAYEPNSIAREPVNVARRTVHNFVQCCEQSARLKVEHLAIGRVCLVPFAQMFSRDQRLPRKGFPGTTSVPKNRPR